MGVFSRAREWDIDVDRYFNRIIPASRLSALPTPISRLLGYRKQTRGDVGNVLGAAWSLVGAVCGLAVVAVVFGHTESIRHHRPPTLIASFGASAVLEYNTIRSPLGQPRNALLGHIFSALIGVSISKLFQLHSDYDSVSWIAGAAACGCASAVMLLTNTVHPPGGASAVLAATDPVITAMGWYFVGLGMWGTTLMLAVGLIVNNIQRQFPMYWWTPLDIRRAKVQDEETVPDAKGGIELKESVDEKEGEGIEISDVGVRVPNDMDLDAEEIEVLERLRERLRKRRESEREGICTDMESRRSSADCTVVASDSSRAGI